MKLTSLLYESVANYQYWQPESDEYVRHIANSLKDELLDGIDDLRIIAPQQKEQVPDYGSPRRLAIIYHGDGKFGNMPGRIRFVVQKQLYAQINKQKQLFDGISIEIEFHGLLGTGPGYERINVDVYSDRMLFRYETSIDDIIAALRLQFIPALMARKESAERRLMLEQIDSKPYNHTDERSDKYVRYAAGVLRDALLSGLDGLMFSKVKTSERANSFVGLGDKAIARDLTVSSHGVGEFHGVTGNMSVLVHKHQNAMYDTENWNAEQDDDGPALLSSFDGIRVFIMFRSKAINSKLSFQFEYETPAEEIVETVRTQFIPLLNQDLERDATVADSEY